MTTRHAHFESPVGPMFTVVTDDHLVRLSMRDQKHLPTALDTGTEDPGVARDVRTQLEEYFSGERRAFDLNLQLRGTPFQLRVWTALSEIPYGEVVSYSELARRVDRPSSVRAVAMANARNPLMIIVPCHRVVGSNGSLTGYAGGLDVKRRLLEIEGLDVRSDNVVAEIAPSTHAEAR